MNILVAVDGSSYTKHLLAYIAAHDEWLGGAHHYTLVNVQEALPARATAVVDKAVLKSYYDEEGEKVFKPIRTFFSKQGIEQAEFVLKVGDPAEQIAALANHSHFDLLLMGSHGHSNWGNLVMGSVATKVMAHTRVPVLLVRQAPSA